MATISSPGIGSGLDISGIITKLMQVEAQPLNKLNTLEASYQSKISALGGLQGAVSSLDTALASLIPSAAKSATTVASLSNSAAGSATASSSAIAGSYSVSIDQLATTHRIGSVSQAQKLVSAPYAAATTKISPGSAGTFTIAVGGAAALAIPVTTNTTLGDLKNSINSAGLGVFADIEPSGGGYRLSIQSNTIGNAGKIVTTNSGGLTGFDFNGTVGSLTQTTAASGFNTSADSIPTGTLSLTVGTSTPRSITINSTNNTLLGLKNAINAAGAGVTASLVTLSSNNTRLVIESNDTGTGNTISLSGLAGLDYDAGTNTGSLSQGSNANGQAAQDAIIQVDATSYTRSRNSIGDVIAGVTLNLSATTPTATTLTVKRDEGLSFASQAAAKFRSYKAALADSTIATATATASSIAGSYALDVVQLATTHRITTPGTQAHIISTLSPKAQSLSSVVFGSATEVINATAADQTLDISVGGGTAVQIIVRGEVTDPDTLVVTPGMTLAELKDAINNAGAGVTASISSAGGAHLVLTSNTAGNAGKITTVGGGGLAGFDFDGVNPGGLSETQAAKGYSSSSDAINPLGQSLTLQVGSGTPQLIDTSSVVTISGLRDAINTANAGVTANIVQDGLGVRLVLTANTGGGAAKITATGLDGFDFNPTTATGALSQAAENGGQLAQGFSSTTTTVPTGTLKVTVGSGSARDITINSTNNTLEGVMKAINAASVGITATLLNTGTDTRLVITSNTIGAGGRISLAGIAGLNFDGSTGTGDLSQSSTDGGQAATGAIIKINGINITSDSNTVTDAVQGVTLTLNKVTTAATNLSVSQDKTSSLAANFTTIVKAYNDLAKAIKDLGNYNAETKSGGALLGNSTLRGVSSAIRNAFSAATAESGTASYKRLSDLGLAMQRDGSISFDSAKFSAAANANYEAVATVAASIGKATKAITASMLGTKGSITAAVDGNKASVDALDKRREALNQRLVQIEARYKKQFSALDTLISSMNTTSSYLTRQLANLPGASSSSN